MSVGVTNIPFAAASPMVATSNWPPGMSNVVLVGPSVDLQEFVVVGLEVTVPLQDWATPSRMCMSHFARTP